MKKILKIAAMLLALSCLSACCGGSSEPSEASVKMLARIIGISDRLEVEVIDGEYGASGIFWVITSDNTEFISADGNRISRANLTVGDEIMITYGGQVMMSYPPQIVAKSITVKK